MQPHTQKKLPPAGKRFLLLSLTAGLLLAPSFACAGEIAGPLPQTDTQTASGSTDTSDAASSETTAAQTDPAQTADSSASTESPALDITPAPTAAQNAEGQTEEGMLSPPSGSSDSVFSRASTADMTDAKLSSLLSTIQSELPTANGEWAVYICDLFNDSEGNLATGSASMQAASLIKLFIMGAVYKIMNPCASSTARTPSTPTCPR